MNNRRKAGIKNRTVAYIAAGVIHAGILAAMLFNYTADKHTIIEAHQADKVDTINASLINEKDIKDQQAKMTKLEQERQRKKREAEQRELDRLEAIKQQADDQQQKVDDLKKQQVLEEQRTAIALKKREEEEERKKKADELKKKQADEKKRLEKIEKQRVEKKKESDRIKREEEDNKERARLSALIAEEEAEQKRRAAEQIAKERTATIQSQYSARIQAAVKRFYRVAPGTNASLKASVSIKVSPLGEVLSVRVLESSGSLEFDQSLQDAISQASPLPIPTKEEDLDAHNMFVTEIRSTFRPYE